MKNLILAMMVFFASQITIVFDNFVELAGTHPIIVDGRTLVDDGIFHMLGFRIERQENSTTLTSIGGQQIVLIVDSDTLLSGGVVVPLDVPAQMIDGRKMMPLRAIFESAGYRVVWREESVAVYIFSVR